MTLDLTKTEWDLSPLLKGDDDPTIEQKREEVKKASYEFINKWKARDDYTKDPSILREALDEVEALARGKFGKGEEGLGDTEGFYFWLRTQQDQTSPELKAKYNKIEEFSLKINNDMQFFDLNIGKIPESEQAKFLNAPELEKYKHHLEGIFKASKHWLSDKEEKILNLKDATAYANWVKMLEEFISKEERMVITESGKKEPKTFEELFSLTQNTNKEVRDDAAKAINEILSKHSNVAEAEMNSILTNKKVDDELRKNPYPEYSRHLSDDIDKETVDSLVSAVIEKNHISKKFYELKAKLLKQDKLAYHERNVPIGKIEKKFSYEEAANIVYEAFEKLDPKFSEIFKRLAENGQIDVYPRKGKSGGGFCVYWLISHPTYILLNHSGTLLDIETLAHELGHAINNELIKEKQHALDFGTPTSTAEVASTFMEDFVIQNLMKGSDEETKLALMMEKLNRDITSIFRQIACYRFEQELHSEFRKKGYISKEEIGSIFQKYMSSYMGDFVELSEGSENWWIYWSHIRRFFYVYSYASGILISKSLQSSIREDPKYVEKVKEFLAAGLSDSPKNIFAKMNIDITDKNFWHKGLDEVENLLTEAETLAKKLGKI